MPRYLTKSSGSWFEDKIDREASSRQPLTCSQRTRCLAAATLLFPVALLFMLRSPPSELANDLATGATLQTEEATEINSDAVASTGTVSMVVSASLLASPSAQADPPFSKGQNPKKAPRQPAVKTPGRHDRKRVHTVRCFGLAVSSGSPPGGLLHEEASGLPLWPKPRSAQWVPATAAPAAPGQGGQGLFDSGSTPGSNRSWGLSPDFHFTVELPGPPTGAPGARALLASCARTCGLLWRGPDEASVY